MKKFTLKDHLIYDESGKPVDIKPSLPEWMNRNSVELTIVREWGLYYDPEDEDVLPELIGIRDDAPNTVKDMYDRCLEREKNRVPVSLEEEADCPWSRWNTPPGIIKTISEPTPEQRKLAEEMNTQRAAVKKVDEIAEAKINLAYSLAAEKATGSKPMYEQRKMTDKGQLHN